MAGVARGVSASRCPGCGISVIQQSNCGAPKCVALHGVPVPLRQVSDVRQSALNLRDWASDPTQPMYGSDIPVWVDEVTSVLLRMLGEPK